MKLKLSEYRKIDKLSASDIKLFDKDRIKFYKYKILKEKRNDLNSNSIIIGTIVDYILSDCKGNLELFDANFDEYFKLLTVEKKNTQMFFLADELIKITFRDTNEEGICTTSYEERFKESFDNVQLDGNFKGKKYEDILKKFNESDAFIYFEECLDSKDKQIVDEKLLNIARNKSLNVLNDENIIYNIEIPGIENLGKTVIEFSFLDMDCKCEIDYLSINHNTKTVHVTEIKSSYDIEDAFEYTYLKLRYDLAAAFYIEGAKSFIKNYSIKNISDYEIVFNFLAVDTSPENLRPLLYEFTPMDYLNTLNGYTLKSGKKYKGLVPLMEEIKWCMDKDIWNISKEFYLNNSKGNLNINYDTK